MRGQLIGNRYRIEHRLGEGGMATVYAALDEKLGRRVAIKILHKHLAENTDLAKRFFQEAHAISNLEHQNILKIFDVSSPDAKVLWIVTELLSGSNLAEFVRSLPQSRMGHNVASLIVREVVKALEKAHAEGVVHRDVKPENIFIVDSGLVKLMDFGIAKNLKTVAVTQTGTFMGSPHYMSPEQIKGTRIDPRSDLYSLGILYYELVTGRLPFNGATTHDVVLKITQGRFLDPSIHEPSLPGDIVKIICKLMSKNRVNRYQKSANLAADLDQYFRSLGLSESHIELERYFADPDAFEKRVFGAAQSIKIRESLGVQAKQAEYAGAYSAPITRIEAIGLGRLESNRKLAKINDQALAHPQMIAVPEKPQSGQHMQSSARSLNSSSSSRSNANANADANGLLAPQTPLRRDRKVSRSVSRAHAPWSGPTAPRPNDSPLRKNTPPAGIKKLKPLRTGRLLLRADPQLQRGRAFFDGKNLRRHSPLLKLAGILGIGFVIALMLASAYLLNSLITQTRPIGRVTNRVVENFATEKKQTKERKALSTQTTLTPVTAGKQPEKSQVEPTREVKQKRPKKEISTSSRRPAQNNDRVYAGSNVNTLNQNNSSVPNVRQNILSGPQVMQPEVAAPQSSTVLQPQQDLSPQKKTSSASSKTIFPGDSTGSLSQNTVTKPAVAFGAYAFVRIKAQPACEIYINGVLKGTSVDETYSSSWIKLSKGDYQLELRRAGYKTVRKKIRLENAQRLDLGTFNLEQEAAR